VTAVMRAGHISRGLALAVLVLAGSAPGVGAQQAATSAPTPARVPPRLRIKSPAFAEAMAIPKAFTCVADGGAGVSPPLEFTNVPAGTLSFAIVATNNDNHPAKGLEEETFWVMWNVPGSSTGIAQGVAAAGELPDGSRQGLVGRATGYRPPCPPPGTGPIHYVFTLYALDQMLTVPPGATRADVAKAMDGHIVGSNILLGLFER
jgi:Raf kinase inhibitor-like YbhB/YbcL family protein